MDHEISKFFSGVHNRDTALNIPKDAASDAKNFVTKDGKIMLAYGRVVVGNEGGVGKIYANHFGYKRNGGVVHYRKAGTKIQYLKPSNNTWTDIVTGLTESADYTFNNYSTLAGAFTIATGIDGIYKFNNDAPGSYNSMYDPAKNDKGYSLIDKGRMMMWNLVNASKTTLKQSWIDAQDGTVYTTVNNENLGASGATHYAGTLAFKAGGATRNMFALVITGATAAGTETFTDNKDGTLTSDKGGSGTIDYMTGAYDINFNGTVNAGNVEADYQWEDSNDSGITDFTFSATRVASEGNRITQDIGGDPIIAVFVGQDGAYYSIKKFSAYRLEISADDLTFTNKVYRRDIGMPFLRAGISTSKGIAFINTANPEKPEFTILQKNVLDSVEPITYFDNFDFSLYQFDDCALETFDRFIAVLCKEAGSDNNDRILLCNTANPVLTKNGQTAYIQTVDITAYPARMLAKSEGSVYGGSPVSENVYQLYNGFDDDSATIDNFWESASENYNIDNLKKYRKKRFSGMIAPDQVVSVEVSYDDAGFEQVGTIRGDGPYVDVGNPQTIGSNMVGEASVGGDTPDVAYPYYLEIKMTGQPKFESRKFRLVAQEIGYFDVDYQGDIDILTFEKRIPKRFRQKQNVSLDGSQEDQ